MGGADPATRMLKQYNDTWTGKRRYKKIELQKLIERDRHIMGNVNFERDHKKLSKKEEGGIEHVGQILEKEKFLKFWAEIWEKDDKTTEMPWMESVNEELRQKITNVKKFNITKETLEK